MTAQLFLPKRPYKSNSALYCRSFQKHSLFTTFLLVFTVVKMCNILNKYWPPDKLAKYIFFTQEGFYISVILKKTGALHRESFSKHLLFSTFSLFLTVNEVCNNLKHTYLLADLLHFLLTISLSIAGVSRNVLLLQHF